MGGHAPMIVCLKGRKDEEGNPLQIEIPVTAPIGICSYPDKTDNPVQEHKIHFFVQYKNAWSEISLKTYNKLAAAGNPVQNVDTANTYLVASGFGSEEVNGSYNRPQGSATTDAYTKTDSSDLQIVFIANIHRWVIASDYGIPGSEEQYYSSGSTSPLSGAGAWQLFDFGEDPVGVVTGDFP
jgi:hypothetical protein